MKKSDFFRLCPGGFGGYLLTVAQANLRVTNRPVTSWISPETATTYSSELLWFTLKLSQSLPSNWNRSNDRKRPENWIERWIDIRIIVPTPLVGGRNYILKWVFFQSILADPYIHRREMWVVSLKSSSRVEFGIKKIFLNFVFFGELSRFKFCVNTWWLAWFCSLFVQIKIFFYKKYKFKITLSATNGTIVWFYQTKGHKRG